jgi:hypothetical protein
MVSFLTEIVGLSADEVEALRAAPAAYDILEVVRATLPREALALRTVDVVEEARTVRCAMTLLVGTHSPPWARLIAEAIANVSTMIQLRTLIGVGHEAIDTASRQVVDELERQLLSN